ncbi:ABC transporter ATP-binding protein [Kitasatospora sp. NPDC057015]|uniref:ABC transporter ATP-binding protein n=1 Tax=Kitasatospora sp. NPDC057015 TaxID=3346001 RepID=UPI0036308931
MTGAAEPGPSGTIPLLRAVGLARTYRGPRTGAVVEALRGVSLTVGRGEFVAVTGPSGAGKSTLLHLFGGLQRPDSGELHLDGDRVDTLGEAAWAVRRRRRIGVVFQTGNLVSNLTVADNVELPALLAGHGARTSRKRRRDLLDRLGLADRAAAAPGALSGGERQRAALARALVNDPDLLLADEPTGSLDSRAARQVLELLAEHHNRGGTIVLVTHDARVAGTADRVISLFDGRITDDARLSDAVPHPVGVAGVIDLGG